MDALKEIEAAWMEWSGYDTAPPGGGPALEKWEAFKAAWVAAKAHGEIQRERVTVNGMRHQKRVLPMPLQHSQIRRDPGLVAHADLRGETSLRGVRRHKTLVLD